MTDQPHTGTPRRDPLSTFLLAAAALLAIMYGLESWQSSNLERQTLAAAAFGASGELPGCTVGSAGQKGEALVLRCPRIDASAALANLTRFDAARLTAFTTVLIHASQGSLVCAPDPSDWPEGCAPI